MFNSKAFPLKKYLLILLLEIKFFQANLNLYSLIKDYIIYKKIRREFFKL